MDAMGLTANQFSRVASNLEDENANLHAQVSDLKLSINEWRAITEARGQTIDRLGFENDKLRELVSGYADSFERSAAMNNGNGPYYSGEDWLSLANDMRFDLAEACGELGNEVDG